jgi:hypothetical protein
MAVFLVLTGTGAEEELKAPEITYKKFGEIVVKGERFTKDIVIEGGEVRKRNKGPSKGEKAKFGHTPLTPKEEIPWECRTLVIGTGMHERLPIANEFKEEAKRRGVKLVILKTREAVEYFLKNYGPDINAIFHITC